MTTLVLTILGNDQPGLVARLAGVVNSRGGNWDTSHMTRLAGKFAGIAMVTVPESSIDSLLADLAAIEAEGLLKIATDHVTKVDEPEGSRVLSLELLGQDQPGIVSDITRSLADSGASIEEIQTQITDAPMGGGQLFKASAKISLPADASVDVLIESLEAIADGLMADIAISPEGS